MSDARPARSHGLQILLGALLLVCVGALVWRFTGPSSTSVHDETPAGGTGELATDVPDERVAKVRGRILLERPLDPPADEQADEEAGQEAGEEPGQEADEEAGEEAGEEPGEDDDEAPAGGTDSGRFATPPSEPDVELEPPEAGRCRITAWQDGVKVSPTVTCDGEGAFEVSLQAGVSGKTAFELEVPGRLRAVVQTEVPAGGVGRLPTVALGVGATLRGQVVDRNGEPISDAQIEAMPQPNLDEPEPWRTRSDETGHFELDTLPPGPVAVRARAPGHAAAITEAITPDDEVVVILDQLHDLRGRVVAAPELLAQAQVRIEGSAIWPARTRQVDPQDGTFLFEEVPEGIYALEAWTTDPKSRQPYASIPLENVTPELAVSLAVVPAAVVPVRVTDPEGNPTPDARVSLSNSSVGLLAKVATTDDEGRALPGPVVPGPYIVRADAPGFLAASPVDIDVTGQQVVDEIVISLPRPGRIEGVVLADDRRPVPHAIVEVQSDALFTVGESQARAETFQSAMRAAGSLGVTQGPVPEIPAFGDDVVELGEVRTDEEGRFVLTGLAPGNYTLQASHGRYAASDSRQIGIDPGQVRTGVELIVRGGHRLTGRIVDANDQPVERAIVELDDGTAYATDDRGLFDAGMRRGRVVLVARGSGKAPQRQTVRMGERDRDVEIRLPDATAALSGRVVGANDQPLQDVRVTVQMADELSPTAFAFTDDRGLWRIDGLPEGMADVDIEALSFVPVTRKVRVRQYAEPLDVQLHSGWTLEVLVRTVGRRDPIEGARVTAGGQLALTDADGLAVVQPLAADRVSVEVEADGYGPVREVATRPEADRGELAVELEEGGGMRGAVVDYRGDPVAGAQVVVRAADTGSVIARTRTSVTGQWSVQGVPEGDVRVEATPPPERADDLAEVEVDSDVLRGHVTHDVDLRFDRR